MRRTEHIRRVTIPAIQFADVGLRGPQTGMPQVLPYTLQIHAIVVGVARVGPAQIMRLDNARKAPSMLMA